MDPEELARERAVIIQEIHQANDTPDDIIFDKFQESAFPAQPIGRPVLGSAELVDTLPRDTLMNYMKSQYAADRIVVAAAGRIDHETFVELTSNAFDSLPRNGQVETEPLNYHGGEYIEARALEQVHVVLGFEGVAYNDPDFYAAAVLSTLLGGGMSSRLFQEVREKRGLVYSIYSFTSNFCDGGIFGIYAGTGSDEVTEIFPVICDELLKLNDRIDEKELARTRAQLKSSILMSLESTSARVEQAARQLQIYGRHISVDEVIEHIDGIQPSDLNRVAYRMLATTPTLAAIGPTDHMEGLDKITARLS